MDSMEQEALSPCGGIFIGSTGWNMGLAHNARATGSGHELPEGLAAGSHLGPFLCVDTDKASREMSIKWRPDTPAIQLPAECGHIIPARSVEDLRQAAMGNRHTRHLGERLKVLPNVSTDSGGGAVPLVAYMSALLDGQLVPLLEQFAMNLRDIQRIQGHTARGRLTALDRRSRVVFAGNGGGSTFNGLVNYAAAQLQKIGNQLGMSMEFFQIVTDPSVCTVANGGNRTIAEANFTMTFRLTTACVSHWTRVSFPTFTGPLTLSGPLWKNVIPWGASNGRVTCANRAQTAASVSLAIAALLGQYGAWADGQFHDGEKETVTSNSNGPACLGRIGIWRATTSADRNRRIAMAAGRQVVASNMLNGE
jgi:hypothetical protein